MAFSHTIGGTTFTESNFDGTAYADETDGFPAALEKVVEHVANAYRGTATDSVAIGTGAKSFTVTNANSQIPAFAVGMPVRISETASPATNYMQGTVTAWTAATGAMTAEVDSVGGSGTISAWTITVGGNISTAPATPVTVANGGTGATSASVARTNLGVEIGTDVLAPTGDGSALTGISSTQPNLIINGGMTVSQRGTSFASLSGTDTYTLDRWQFESSGSPQGVVTVTQSTDVPAGGGFGSSLKVDCTTAEAAVAAGERIQIIQRIEGQNLQHLDYGAAGANTLALRFWIKSPKSGTHCVALSQSSGSSNSYVREFTVASADTWEEITTVTFPGDTGGQINNDNTEELQLQFPLVAGSNFQVTVDQWAAGYDQATSNQQNLLDNTANNFYLTGVKLEVGSSATSFEHESYGETLAKCQRYFWRAAEGDQQSLPHVAQTATTAGSSQFMFAPEMRNTPTIAYSNLSHFGIQPAGAQQSPATLSITYADYRSAWVHMTWTTSGAAQECTRWYTLSASATFDFIAEL